MKKIFYVSGLLVLLSSAPTLAQTAPDIVVVRIDAALRKVVITRGEDKSEITDFKTRFGVDKALSDFNEMYYATIKKMMAEGYVLQERLDANPGTSTFLFVKNPRP